MKSGDERGKLGSQRGSDDGHHQRSKQDAEWILLEQENQLILRLVHAVQLSDEMSIV